jgi:hypothetical protein
MMFWLFVLALGSAVLWPTAALIASPRTRPYALLPLWVFLPLGGWFAGLLLGSPGPTGDKAAGPAIGLMFILIALLAMPTVTLAAAIFVGILSSTRKHAFRVFAPVIGFAAAALIGVSVARAIPEWRASEASGTMLWRMLTS